jgi:hypothetical protein
MHFSPVKHLEKYNAPDHVFQSIDHKYMMVCELYPDSVIHCPDDVVDKLFALYRTNKLKILHIVNKNTGEEVDKYKHHTKGYVQYILKSYNVLDLMEFYYSYYPVFYSDNYLVNKRYQIKWYNTGIPSFISLIKHKGGGNIYTEDKYYYDNGVQSVSETTMNRDRDGKCTECYRSGNLMCESTYDKGKLIERTEHADIADVGDIDLVI